MNSEELYKKAMGEENDFRFMNLQLKALREKRSEKFQEYLPYLENRYEITKRENNSYTINTQEYGNLDYFPKANNLLIRKDNQWVKPGLKWIIENLLKLE